MRFLMQNLHCTLNPVPQRSLKNTAYETLPIALAMILAAAGKKKIVGEYRHPLWMHLAGWIVVAATSYMGTVTITQSWNQLFQ